MCERERAVIMQSLEVVIFLISRMMMVCAVSSSLLRRWAFCFLQCVHASIFLLFMLKLVIHLCVLLSLFFATAISLQCVAQCHMRICILKKAVSSIMKALLARITIFFA